MRLLVAEKQTSAALHLPTRLCAAPMAGITDQPFRLVLRLVFKGLIFSEMVSASGLYYNPERQRRYTRFCRFERPIGIQLFGNNADHFYHAATRLNELQPDILDINMGCPARKVRSSGSGSALLLDLERAKAIVDATLAGFAGPVSVKIRLLHTTDMSQTIDFIDEMADRGIHFVTVHLRSVLQSFGYALDYNTFGPLFSYKRLPIVFNGGINTRKHIDQMESLGSRYFMIGHGMLGRPWIFEQLTGFGYQSIIELFQIQWAKLSAAFPDLAEERDMAIKDIPYIHFRLLSLIKGPSLTKEFRKFFNWYSRGLPGARTYRNLVNRLQHEQALAAVIKKAFYKWQPLS